MKKLKWSPKGRKDISKRMRKLKEQAATVFHYEDDKEAQLLDFIMLPAVALDWKTGNPLWGQVIGAPGSGKTAHVSLFEDWADAKFVSRLGKNSLISGFRPDGDLDSDPSFILELDGKILVVKDYTCILQGPREERDAVVGQLRDVYDGRASRVLGHVGLQEYEARFNMMIAVTSIIDSFHGVTVQLGERFISRREMAGGRVKMTEAAFENVLHGRQKKNFEGLKDSFIEFLSLLPSVKMAEIKWSSKMRSRAIVGADFVARARSHVVRESDGKSLATKPSPEVGTRLVTQLIQCVAGYCILNGLNKITKEAWDFGGGRILRDTMPTVVAWTLFQVYLFDKRCKKMRISSEFTIKDILPMTRLGNSTVDQVVTDMYHNGILNIKYTGRTGRRLPKYRLRDSAMEEIEFIRLFEGYSGKEADIATMPKRVRSRERKGTKRDVKGKGIPKK